MSDKTDGRPAPAGRPRRAAVPLAAVPDLPAPGRTDAPGTNQPPRRTRPPGARPGKPGPRTRALMGPVEVDAAASAAGRSSHRRGKERRDAAIDYLRAHGFPGAAVEQRNNSNDIYGVGLLGIEVTVEPMENIAHKVEQAKSDATRLGRPYWFVWKHRKGSPNPGVHYAITEANVILDMAKEIDRLTALSLDTDAAYTRGYEAARRLSTQGG